MPKFKILLTRTQYREVEVLADDYDAAADAALDTSRAEWSTLWAVKPEDDIEVDLLSFETEANVSAQGEP